MATQIDFVAESPPLWQEEDGTIRVRQPRVTLDTVICSFNQRMSAEEIARAFPTLDLADRLLNNRLLYYATARKWIGVWPSGNARRKSCAR